MPPKKKSAEPSKKTEQKKKEKVIEDKTFGLKNKKGAKTQKFIQQVQHQVKFGNQSARKVEQLKADKNKDDKKKEIDELNQLFRPIQKVEKGADPKSVLCAFYKQGHCTKGDKCKFSHDLTIERKSEKRNVYVDMRDEEDNMENWDEAKLKEVVEKKHGETEKSMPKTTIICKYFLDALENNKYGWFWECPNGGNKCHYRHALPSGFVLKKDKKKEEKEEEISIEDLVERERAKLTKTLTKITLASFLEWKNKKLKEKAEATRKEEERRKAEFKAGRHVGLSGREMFTFQPELANEGQMEDDEAAYDVLPCNEEEEEIANNYTELTLDELSKEATEVDGTGTVVSQRHWEEEQKVEHKPEGEQEHSEAAGGDCAIPIDEHLFEDDDDLDELEEDLADLKC